MSKNVIKQIQHQIQKKNQKFVMKLKTDVTETFKEKENEIQRYFSQKEKKIKKVYINLISKLDGYKLKQNEENEQIKNMLDKVNS
ncbi:hypothetical protein BDAP_000994 [Binucleata daphniae]